MNLKQVSIVAFACLPMMLSGCSQAPDCASVDANKLVISIAKDNNVFKDQIFQEHVHEKVENAEKKFAELEDKVAALKEQYEEAYRNCREKSQNDCYDAHNYCAGEHIDEYALRWKENCRECIALASKTSIPLLNEIKATKESYLPQLRNVPSDVRAEYKGQFKNIVYTLTNIVTSGKNAELKSSQCKGTLLGEVPQWGSAKSNFNYVLETTSDGELMATVMK